MADNLTTDAGVVATDEIGGAHVQWIKLAFGADNSFTPITAAAPLPVTMSSLTPGSAAASLGKAEDAAHTSGDVGVMALGVRKDTLASLAGTDGDYTAPVFDSLNRLYVAVDSRPAHDATTDSIESEMSVDKCVLANAEYSVSRATINTAASGDTEILAAPGAGNAHVIVGYDWVVGGATNLRWKRGSTLIGGTRNFAANAVFVKAPYFAYVVGGDNEAIILNSSAAVQVSGDVLYITT